MRKQTIWSPKRANTNRAAQAQKMARGWKLFKVKSRGIELLEETVGREFFRFAQHPPHTRFDTMGGFFDQYKELLGTLSPYDMVPLSFRSRYVSYPFEPEMCSKL